MKISIPYPSTVNVKIRQSETRLLLVKKEEINNIQNSIDYLETWVHTDIYDGKYEILIAKPSYKKPLIDKPRFLFKELLNVEFNKDQSQDLSLKDKKAIRTFVEKYSLTYPSKHEINSSTRQISYLPDDKKRFDLIDWLFMPYQSNPNPNNPMISYFYAFRNAVNDIERIYEAIKNDNKKELSRYSNKINAYLKDNCLTFSIDSEEEGSPAISWHSKTVLSLCFLEILEVISRNLTIKDCAYCEEVFFEQRSNVILCSRCRDKKLYRKSYYILNGDEERRKAKKRMRKLRSKRKDERQK